MTHATIPEAIRAEFGILPEDEAWALLAPHASPLPAGAPAPPMTVSAMRQAVEDAALAVRIRPDDADRVARHQLLIAQLYDLETTGRLAAKR